jgi:uncharacterized phage-like protein YoqJ
MQKRNEYIVDNSSLLLSLWDGTSGGTKNCLDYAKKKEIPWENIWDAWVKLNS